jgi:hypothetical protein
VLITGQYFDYQQIISVLGCACPPIPGKPALLPSSIDDAEIGDWHHALVCWDMNVAVGGALQN